MSAEYVAFREAVLDLSDAPTKANIVRYLEASRALDGWPPRGRPKRASRNRKRPLE